jgi:hypothetical protein
MFASACQQEVLEALHPSGTALAELCSYDARRFRSPSHGALPLWPIPEAPHVAAWRIYAKAAEQTAAIDVLRDALVQLRFPLREGISQTDAYAAATRRGVAHSAESNDPSMPCHGAEVTIEIYPSIGGMVPVIVAENRSDFVQLVQALAHRNEPVLIPDSMGACIVQGFNNWDRVARLKQAWRFSTLGDPSAKWGAHFRDHVAPNPGLYRDCFIVLSQGPYSNVPAQTVGLDPEGWTQRSLRIRLAHECAHLFTQQVLGSMENHLLDELVADCMGIIAAEGKYRAEWALSFLGVESKNELTRGGRMENYTSADMSPEAISVLTSCVHAAVGNIDQFLAKITTGGHALDGRARVMTTLCSQSLIELAHPDAASHLAGIYAAASWPDSGPA